MQYVYLDPDYFLEIRIESQRSVRGVKETVITDHGDYEKVAGVFWAFSITSGRKGDGDPAKILVRQGRSERPAGRGLFSFPAAAKN